MVKEPRTGPGNLSGNYFFELGTMLGQGDETTLNKTDMAFLLKFLRRQAHIKQGQDWVL